MAHDIVTAPTALGSVEQAPRSIWGETLALVFQREVWPAPTAKLGFVVAAKTWTTSMTRLEIETPVTLTETARLLPVAVTAVPSGTLWWTPV
jgi:hypothetical protein